MADSTRPPPPPKSGGGSFIAAAIVMLLLMGGLIYWKVSGGDEEAKPPTPTPVASAPPPMLEAPPPPPPKVEDTKDAGTKVARGTGKAGIPAGSCGPECKGTAPSALQGALRGKAGAARGCYERALRQNAMLQGKIMVAMRVGAQGQVCSASIASNSLGDPGVASCVLGIFRSSSFPPPLGGCVDVQVPMNFIPKTGPGT